ncbi:hypothetical protein V6N12_031620 [Hibiscus sabdariffa]|uniref:Uncharacterized protein n=1 Tax=Hibiscus sabdariffa TaxID=183260 RepID=A0ABR2DV02_9ROSI
MQEGSSITQHIIKMNAMAKELELEGVNLPKELLSVVLLESLPESRDDVVTSITMDLGKDEEALRLDNICIRLMNARDVNELFKSRDNDESSSRFGDDRVNGKSVGVTGGIVISTWRATGFWDANVPSIGSGCLCCYGFHEVRKHQFYCSCAQLAIGQF